MLGCTPPALLVQLDAMFLSPLVGRDLCKAYEIHESFVRKMHHTRLKSLNDNVRVHRRLIQPGQLWSIDSATQTVKSLTTRPDTPDALSICADNYSSCTSWDFQQRYAAFDCEVSRQVEPFLCLHAGNESNRQQLATLAPCANRVSQTMPLCCSILIAHRFRRLVEVWCESIACGGSSTTDVHEDVYIVT